MNKCLIIGSGIAGLNAASILSSKKFPVTILESSPKFGGRTYSYKDPDSNDMIDNGQHILMGCYDDTINFLKLVRAEKNFNFQNYLEVNFLTSDRKEYSIKASSLFYPLNLLAAVLNYNVLDFMDKLRLIGFMLKLPFISRGSLKNISVSTWLVEQNQNDRIIKALWEILCVGALNTSTDKASAEMFHNILMKIFFAGNKASRIILPKLGLTESVIDPALAFINSNNGKIICSETVKEFLIEEDKVVAVKSENNMYNGYDFIISTIPFHALTKIKNSEKLNIDLNLSYSTILNIHLWLSEIRLDEKFYGLINSEIHWIFNKGSHLNIVISDANKFAEVSEEKMIDLVFEELEKFTSIKRKFLTKYKIIREKRATFIPNSEILNKRPSTKTNLNNLFLAGDWTNTGLPATIEGAAKSGRLAAEQVISSVNS